MYHHRHAFFWDSDLGEFLFPGLNISGTKALILLCLVLVVLSIVYESIKVIQTRTKARTARERQRTASCAASETANLLINERQRGPGQVKFSKKFWSLFNQASVFLFQTTLGYFLMLAVMVYNGYVFIIIILSMALGYFFFGHISMKINMENIRARTTNVICSSACPPSNPASTSGPKHARTGYTNELASDSSDNSTTSDNTSAQTCHVEIVNNHHANIVDSCRL